MNPRFLRRVLVVPALALAFSAAACGDDSADFVEGYNAAVEPMNKLMTDFNTNASGAGADPAKAGDQLTQVADGLEKMRTDLAELSPPEDAKDELDKLLSTLDKGTDQVRDMASAAKDSNLDALTKATTAFSKTGTDLISAEQQLRSAVDG